MKKALIITGISILLLFSLFMVTIGIIFKKHDVAGWFALSLAIYFLGASLKKAINL